MSAKPSAIAVFSALTALLFWGGTAIANRYAVGFAEPIVVAALRSVLAGVVALVVALSFRLEWPAVRSDQALLLLSGVCSFALWPALLSIGLAYTTASHAALIMATLPIITVLLASLIERMSPAVGWWVGGSLALAGAFFLILDGNSALQVSDTRSAAIGDLIILAGCVVCAAGYVAGGKLSPKIGAFATTFWGLSVALLITVPAFALSQQNTDWSALPVSAWLAIAWLTLLSSLLGYLLWFFALGRGGIERIGSLQLLMPVITLAGAVLVLGETLTTRLVVLAALVLLGTVVAHRHAA